jgi:hypothetical protein
MPFYYAQINNGKVVSVLESSNEMENKPEHVIQIDSFNVRLVNKLYIDGQFVDPPPLPKIYSRVQLIDKLGDDYYAIVAAAKTDVQVEVWLEKFRLTDTFVLSDPAVVQQLQFLVAKGFVTQDKIDALEHQ